MTAEPGLGVAAAVEARGLVKEYGGRRVLDEVDLAVEPGSVYGFLGRNGAGKTTTLRILLGLARPTSGVARVLGQDVTRVTNDVRGAIGFLPDVPGYYPWMTAREFLAFCGRLFGIAEPVLSQRIDVLLDLAGLAGTPQRVGGYSRGMKQRLGVAQALINTPRLLLLDEPTSALDPLGRKAVLDMIESLRGRTTVLFSTHILSDVERVCDTVAIIEEGRVLVQAPVEELKARYSGGMRFLLQVTEGLTGLRAVLDDEAWVAGTALTERDGRPAVEVRALDEATAHLRLPRLLAELGLGLIRMEPVEVSLEDVFVDLVGGHA